MQASEHDRRPDREAALRDGLLHGSRGLGVRDVGEDPPGVLDDRTLAYPDFRGNRQYISTGNLEKDDRVALIFMDYADPARLKLLGRARIIDAAQAPQLASRLELPGYRAKVERVVLIAVEAFDWNCPQHITPRYTAAEFEASPSGSDHANSLKGAN
jgi:predicted pyridoxine 5'-phosphate oxidase superfamily flavin-nucleotide-binding protein